MLGISVDLDYDTKIDNIEGKTPSINGLAAATVITAAEYKICNVSDLVKKANYHVKISECKKLLYYFSL